MRLLSVLATKSFPLLVFGVVLAGSAPPAVGTALDDYVASPDPSYGYTHVNTITGSGYTANVFDMTSQTWRSPTEVNRTLWHHWVTVIIPDEVDPNYHKALLWISGGDNGGPVPTSVDSDLANIATTTKSVAVVVKMVPNQYLTFAGQAPRDEDALIAYTWDKFLKGGDPNWPAQLPMVKSAVRAMDMTTDFCTSYSGGSLTVNEFVVTGASKRGWATWLTAAVDPRVVGIIPVVIDLLNVEPSFIHHYAAYGFWAPAVQDYVDMGIMSWVYTPELDELMAIVDAYSYRSRYSAIPKFMINASGDDFFLPDSSQFYLDDLPGEKYVQYFPNADHWLHGTYLPDSLLAYYHAILKGTARPGFSWTFQGTDSIHVQTGDSPTQVKMWKASNPDARDFRKNPHGMPYSGPVWTSSTLTDQGGGLYKAQMSIPSQGWSAFFVELQFDSGQAIPFTFTTPVRIVPEAATLRVSVINNDSGYVVPVDPNFPRYYPLNATATLTAHVNPGKTFVHWRIYDPNYFDPNTFDPNFPGDPNHAILDANNPVAVVMDASREVSAVFTGDPLVVTVQADPNVILTGETSTLTATVAGGVPPYEYNWSTDPNGTDTITFGPNEPNEYLITLTVFDGLRTPAEASVTVKVVDPLSVSLRAAPPVVGTNGNSRLTATVTGGDPPYQYDWSTGDSGSDTIIFDPPSVGQHQVTVTVRDALDANAVSAATVTQVSAQTPLADYVAAPDPNYAYNLVNTVAGPGYTAYVLDMYSQTWRRELEPNEVDRALWQHWLTVVVPDTLNPTFEKALLFIDGGSNNPNEIPGPPPTSAAPEMVNLAMATGSVIAHLAMVPNQKLEFENDGQMRGEDDIIAYTFRKYRETGDETWPALLPMVKSAVRAMDTVQTFLVSASVPASVVIDHFVVTGGSKRGWTTWLTGAVDDRVVAIIPAVMDALNLDVQMTHHLAVYGFYAPTLQPYVNEGVMDSLYTPEGQALLAIVDPYAYRGGDRLRKIPKFMINSAGDSFFVPDSSQFYSGDLQGDKYLRYVPNTDHDLGGPSQDAINSLVAFYQSVLSDDVLRPQFSWTFEGDGSIRVQAVSVPGVTLTGVNLWKATVLPGPSGERDFRFSTQGPIWSVDNSGLTLLIGGLYRATVDVPTTGWTGFFVELEYSYGGPVPYKFTTDVRVVPETPSWFELDVQINDSQLGQVQRDPEPPAPNNVEYPFGTEVTLTALPEPNNTFVQWELFDPNYPGDPNHAAIDDSNNPTTVVMDAEREVKAYFAEPVEVTIVFDPNAIPIGGSRTLTAVPTKGWGPFGYLWSTNETTPSITVSLTNSADYTVTVTDSLGQQAKDAVTVKVGLEVAATADPNVIVSGGISTLTATPSGGRGPYTHAWSNSTTGANTQVTATTTTVYTVTTTDADAQTAQADVTVEVASPVSATATATPPQIPLGGSSTLSVTASDGWGAYQYEWTPTGQTDPNITVTPNNTTDYTVRVTDELGQTSDANVTVTVELDANAFAEPNLIAAGQTAILTAVPSGGIGPYFHSWDHGPTGVSVPVTPQVTTVYTVTTTDARGQTDDASVTVTVIPGLGATATALPSTIFVGGSSTLTALVTGGQAPYTYEWDTGDPGPIITVAPSQTTDYTVTVTDNMSQQAQATVTVTVGVTVNAVAEPDLIAAGNTVTLTARASGGLGPYAYAWSNGLTGITVKVAPVATTTYTVTATDSNSQTGQDQVTVAVAGKLGVSATANPQAIISGQIAQLTAMASSGVPPYTYSWSTGEPGATIAVDPAATTSYKVTATDSLDQQATASVVVEVRYQYPLNVSVQGNGTVSPSGGVYDAGTKVTLTAKPVDGHSFAFWGGDLAPTDDPMTNPLFVTMNARKDITAVFTATQGAPPAGTGQPVGAPLPQLPPGCGGLVGTQQLGLFWALCWVGLLGLYVKRGRGCR